MPEVRERIQQMGFIPVGSSPEQFNAQFKLMRLCGSGW